MIKGYQKGISPVLRLLSGGQPMCRYDPSCSHYFHQALESHGLWKGSFLGIKRILRCHPWGGCGYDPVPESIKEHPANKSEQE